MIYRVVEYGGSENITRPLSAHKVIKANLASEAEGVAEINRLFRVDDWKLTGYNEELDYYWGRMKGPSQPRRILRVERT